MLEQVLQFEIGEIIEFIEEQEDAGTIDIQSFSWKQYTFHNKGDAGYYVIEDQSPESRMDFDNLEQALLEVKGRILDSYLNKSS